MALFSHGCLMIGSILSSKEETEEADYNSTDGANGSPEDRALIKLLGRLHLILLTISCTWLGVVFCLLG